MKRILFVDDDPNVLDGLRRMLRPLRHQWEMCFADSGEKALELLAERPCDVIVSDMRMPGMDGAELLTEVMQRYPDTVRMVLSGHSDREMIFRSIGCTHVYLSKPCHGEGLKSAVSRACALRDLLRNESLQQVISQMQSLPSLPALYVELMAELQRKDTSLNAIAEIVSKDLGMTAKILQLVNSAFFGIRNHVSSPKQAINLIGLDILRALALSLHVFSQFDHVVSPAFHVGDLWAHGLTVGKCAQLIARAETKEQKTIDDSLTAGLLHDCGKLVLASGVPELFREAMELAQAEEISPGEAERRVFGTTHAEVGAYLLGLWGLPDAVVEAVAYHHHPDKSLGERFDALTAVHVAVSLEEDQAGGPPGAVNGMIDYDYLSRLGLADRLPAWQEIANSLDERGILK